MQIVVVKDYHEMSRQAAAILIHQIKSKPSSVLALPTGETPRQFYRQLVDTYKKGEVSFAQARAFNLDEYLGLSLEDQGSFAAYMATHLFSQTDFNKAHWHIPNGKTTHAAQECALYEKQIAEAGGLDLAVLGIGTNGHIGFNEPGTPFNTKTHLATLTDETIESNLHQFGDKKKAPTQALTMGLKTIMGARKIILLASGPRKAKAVGHLVQGPLTRKFPASLLQTHDDVTLIIDEGAASELKKSGQAGHSLCDFTIYEQASLPRGKSIVVISPHPDDSSISAGGTLSLLSPHNTLHLLIMTSGHHAFIPGLARQERIAKRQEEVKNEARILGASEHFLNLDYYDKGKISARDRATVLKQLLELNPDIVLLPSIQDPHPNHKMSTQITLDGLHDFVTRKKKIVELWHYETPWSFFQPWEFNAVVQVPKATIEQKMKAIRCHQSQTERTPFDEVAKALAVLRGAVIPEQVLGVYGQVPPKMEEHAEVFSVTRLAPSQGLIESISGVRGVYGIDLTDEIAEAYAYAYGSWLQTKVNANPKVVVGRDTRPSGKNIMEAVVRGLQRASCHIARVEIGTTPLIQFEVRNQNCDGGVIITASHNEPDWNGFKFLWRDGGILEPDFIEEVSRRFHQGRSSQEPALSDNYIQFLFKTLGPQTVSRLKKSRLKVVVDPNGGSMIVLIKSLFERLGIRTVELNMAPGVFRHTVEPTRDALKFMGPIIKKNRAALGVGWDCDGDRVEIVLPDGRFISGHLVLALLVDEVLTHTKRNKKVVISNATSQIVNEIAARHNATVYETDVGEHNVVKKMYQLKAPVGGEGSCGGGIVPPSRCRDGVLTLFKILAMMTRTQKSLSEILADYPKFHTIQKNIKLDVSQAPKVRSRIEKYYSGFPIQKRGGLNGAIKVKLSPKSFVLFRPSRTESAIFRIIADAPTAGVAKRIMEEAVELIS